MPRVPGSTRAFSHFEAETPLPFSPRSFEDLTIAPRLSGALLRRKIALCQRQDRRIPANPVTSGSSGDVTLLGRRLRQNQTSQHGPDFLKPAYGSYLPLARQSLPMSVLPLES